MITQQLETIAATLNRIMNAVEKLAPPTTDEAATTDFKRLADAVAEEIARSLSLVFQNLPTVACEETSQRQQQER